MSNITAALVKELRERTGAGMMECKKALVETNGDIEAAIENMRVNGQAKAAKKASRTAAEGVVLSRFADNGKKGYIVELNCETDFVAKDAGFLELANKVADYVKANDTTDLEAVKAEFETERAALVAKIGENMTIRRVEALEGSYVGGYNHGSKISVLVAVSVEDADLAKKLGMHVASSRPEYVYDSEIPAAVLEKELNVQKEIAAEDADFQKKPANIQEKILEGRMNNFKKEVTFTLQPFVVDPSVDVKTFLAQSKATIEGFVRLEVGEGIVKEEEDFAAEVAKVTGSFQ